MDRLGRGRLVGPRGRKKRHVPRLPECETGGPAFVLCDDNQEVQTASLQAPNTIPIIWILIPLDIEKNDWRHQEALEQKVTHAHGP